VKRSKKDSIELDTKSLVREAVKELQKMLRNPDEKVKLRAISIILRHSERVSLLMRQKSNDPLTQEIDELIESINRDFQKFTKGKGHEGQET